MKYEMDFVPAFPQNDTDDMGMSIRCYLAGQALAGLCANSAFITDGVRVSKNDKATFVAGIAISATQIADALLAELGKEKA